MDHAPDATSVALDRRAISIVLPSYSAISQEHFAHLPSLVVQISKRARVFLLVERLAGPRPSGEFEVLGQRFRWLPLRFAEMLLILIWLRLRGFQRFYSHYSYLGALAAAFVTRACGGLSFYWNCGEAKQFEIPWSVRPRVIREKLATDVPLKLSLRLSHYLVTGTEGMAGYYVRCYRLPREKIRVVPNSIDVSRLRRECPERLEARRALSLPFEAPVVLFVHRLSRRKGAHHILPLARGILARVPEMRMLVVGDGPLRSEIERAVRREGLAERVWVVGGVPNREMGRYYAASDLLLLPSEEEGFPRVLLEAMVFGVPFIALDVGGVREVVPPEALDWIVPRGDVASLQERAVALLHSEASRASLVDAGSRWVERFDVERVASIFEREVLSA